MKVFLKLHIMGYHQMCFKGFLNIKVKKTLPSWGETWFGVYSKWHHNCQSTTYLQIN
jgi:hypothetical protein